MAKTGKKKDDRFRIIRGYLKRYKSYLIWGGLAVIASNGLMLINPYLMKIAFDKLELKVPSSEIMNIALLIVALAIVSGVFRFIMRRTIIWMSRKVEYDLRSDLFAHLLKLNPTFYYNNKTGDIMARSTNDVEAVRMMVGPGIMHIANAFISTIIALAFMLYLSPKLTLYSLIPLPVLSIAVNQLGTAVHKRFARIQEYFSVLTSRVQENVSGVRVLRAYNQEEYEIEDFSRHSNEYIRLNIKMIKIQGIFFPLLFTLAGAVNLSVFYFGGRAVIGQEISLGTLVAFFAYLTMLIWPMIAMGWVVSLYQRGTASLDRINNIFKTKPEVVNSAESINGKSFKGKIEFKNLNFGYNNEKILHDINLKIEPGMSIGIIGPTASGKTTFVSLISRLFPIDRGQLFIDDIDINDIDLETLRSQIGFVPQEPFLFSDTITNNILFSTDQGNQSQAREAAYKAVIDSEIDAFPHGYDSELGERGISLSGGQKQRVAIARALVSDPAILILDDATSAVDTETEHAINQRLSSEIKKRTSIIISHRSSAVKDVDLIIYLENGRIVESGSHEQLLKLNQKYAGVYKMQLIEQELEQM
ncbi:MAG: ABC transporter ATP-binding protein [Candidatus Zixiibacteriota bacterium]